MSRSYPIWNEIHSCAYQSGKSYGVKQTGDVTVRVGSSASNSHVFLRHSTTHRQHENGDREFRFYLDGKEIRRAVLRKGSSTLERQPVEMNKLPTSAQNLMLTAYAEWRNDFLTYEGFANHHGLTCEEAEQFINLARKIAEHGHPEE